MRYIWVIATLSILLLTLFVGCSSDDDDVTPVQTPASTAGATYVDVPPIEARELIDTTANLVILDVSPLYAQGHFPGAINHPMFDGSLKAAVPSLNKSVPYLVYCHSDNVSIAAANLLINNGFETVYRLAGNYTAWVDAGYAVETGTSTDMPA
ncbi:MAG: rhodanese-like domain-containing protein [Planctomycetes bacterium]|nr:rhodanese-like domain-containing protein [Planctomycetota bacterium]